MTFKELQKRTGYNQVELADMIGVTQSAINHFFHGKAFSARIAHAIDVLADVEPGTTMAAAKKARLERQRKAQRRIKKLGIDLTPPETTEETESTETTSSAASEAKQANITPSPDPTPSAASEAKQANNTPELTPEE